MNNNEENKKLMAKGKAFYMEENKDITTILEGDALILSSTIRKSPEIDKLITALHKASLDILMPEKTGVVSFQKREYTKLLDIIKATRKPLLKHGIIIQQHPHTLLHSSGELIQCLTTIQMHTSGQWIESTLQVIIEDKYDMQKLGGGITYLRRYTLQSILFLDGENDDDGYVVNSNKGYNAKKQETINAKQVNELKALVGKSAGLEEQILKAYNINKLEDISTQTFNALTSSLS